MLSRNLSGTSPLVSIIVPVYNTAEYVEECIQSILSQSYENIELILVNDGSTDDSGYICMRYVDRPNVYYVEQENSGTSAARKKGVGLAGGEWILFVDSDDYLLEDAISNMVALAKNTDIVIGGHKGYDGLDKYDSRINAQRYRELIYSRQITVSPCAKLYRKALFNESTLDFPRYFVLGEDYLMNVRIAVDNTIDVKVNHYPVYYRRSVSTSTVHTHNLSLDYCQQICSLADEMTTGVFEDELLPLLQMRQRLVFFYLTLHDTHFQSDSRHPFVQEIKHYMDEAGVWQLLDRWLLSISSPLAVKSVWNLRRVAWRLQHPLMIFQDLKRIKTKSVKV